MGDFIRYDVREVDLNKPLLRTNAGVLLAAGDKSANQFGAILPDTKLYIDSKFTALQNAILAQGVNV